MEHCYWNLLHPQAGIMLDSIPAPGDEFSFSIFTPESPSTQTVPRPSPNPSPFIFSIKLIYYN